MVRRPGMVAVLWTLAAPVAAGICTLNVLFNTTDSCAGTVPIYIDWVTFERKS